METLENTNGAVTKTDLRWRGMHPCPVWLRPRSGVQIRMASTVITGTHRYICG